MPSHKDKNHNTEDMFMKFKPLTWLPLKCIQLLPAVLRAIPKAGLAKVPATAASSSAGTTGYEINVGI